jgi:diguanylate cyclase (GGDEF)-like protein
MPFSDRPRNAQLYVAGVCTLATGLGIIAASQASSSAPAQLFALLVLAATIAHIFPVSTPGKQSYHVSLPFFVAAIIILSPLQLVALVGVVHLAESVRVRRSTGVQIFNAATYAATGLVAQAVYRELWTGQPNLPADISQPACLAAGLAAAATFVVLNRGFVSLAIWLANGIPVREQHMFELEGLLTDAILLLMGIPLAHLASMAPWAAAVGAAPLWLIHRVLDLPNVRAQSRQDGLTELFTAPYLNETCTRELKRCRRFDRPVSLLLLDIDALRELNASFGQQMGDSVLRATARVISNSLREYDLPARLAGGLFAVLLPETDLAQAQIVAERIRRSTAEHTYEVPGSVEHARATLSIGATVVDGQTATAAQLFDAAQSALAMAKREGGNQIAFQAVASPVVVGEREHEASSSSTNLRVVAPVVRMALRERARPSIATSLRQHAQTAALGTLAAVGLGVCLLGVIADLDWVTLAAMLSLSALAGFAFYFKSLPVALALVRELNRSPRGLMASRYLRMWPQYAAVGMGILLAVYAYGQLGITGAAAILGFALLVRRVAGRYVDHSLEAVRMLRTANEALEHRAFHDPLTNVPNRALFAERLEHAMVRAGSGSIAVLFLDLDNFKAVNDTLGHASGDALLIAATRRLTECVRREDTIARLGGDEFTVLLEDMHDPSDAARMAERISDALRTPFDIRGQQVTVSSSIGIALDTDRSHRPDDLLREADLAMYRAKSGGKARYEIFDTGMAERAMQRLGLETELSHAVERGEMHVDYQRLVTLGSGKRKVEALTAQPRWLHPGHGVLDQAEFLALAEDTGAIQQLGAWLLQQACRDAQAWQASSPGLTVHVGLTARQLDQPELPALVRSALDASGLAPHLLRLELDESMLAHADDSLGTRLEQIVKLGVRLALKGVGAGTLPLSRLSATPIDLLKLHPAVQPSSDLAGAVLAMGSALGMTVAAEADSIPMQFEAPAADLAA